LGAELRQEPEANTENSIWNIDRAA
jgi:hypothetical protein